MLDSDRFVHRAPPLPVLRHGHSMGADRGFRSDVSH